MASSARGASFEELQDAFVARLGQASVSDLDTGTIVLVPSATFPVAELRKIVGIQHYEERLLCFTLLLERPRLHMVYVTSLPVDPAVIDYYLGFLPDPAGARRRLTMVALGDPSPEALSPKLLRHADALEAVVAAAGSAEESYMLTFNVTDHERALSERLGIPLYGAPPGAVRLGSKTGSRQVAQRAGVAVCPGAEDLFSVDDVEHALRRIRKERPEAEAVVVKLNHGFSGQGNAIVELGDGAASLQERPTVFCADEESWPSFAGKIAAEGAVVEQLLRTPGTRSPSVQLRISPAGAVEVISTHDQILGGPDKQVYLGCRFPAAAEYRLTIQSEAEKVAAVLAGEGVMGPFGIDFIVVPDGDSRAVYLSEINLRMGGTTHPHWMARLVTGGSYDHETGELVTHAGSRCYVATDNLKSPSLVGRTPGEVIAGVAERGLAFDPETCTGATLHLLGAVERYGKMGATCIAPSLREADHLFGEVSRALTAG